MYHALWSALYVAKETGAWLRRVDWALAITNRLLHPNVPKNLSEEERAGYEKHTVGGAFKERFPWIHAAVDSVFDAMLHGLFLWKTHYPRSFNAVTSAWSVLASTSFLRAVSLFYLSPVTPFVNGLVVGTMGYGIWRDTIRANEVSQGIPETAYGRSIATTITDYLPELGVSLYRTRDNPVIMMWSILSFVGIGVSRDRAYFNANQSSKKPEHVTLTDMLTRPPRTVDSMTVIHRQFYNGGPGRWGVSIADAAAAVEGRAASR